MDRYPGYESMLTRVEHMKMQLKADLAPEQFHMVDDLVAFVFDQVDECCNVPTVDASTDTTEDYPLSDGPVTRGALADDTRIDVIGQANPQVDHQHEGSISSGQTVSPVPPPPTGTHSSIQTNIKVEVEGVSSGQLVQHIKCVKKEEEDGGEYVMECDCEDCETCRVKMEMKEELDESGETELGGNSGLIVQSFTRVKKEEGEDEAEVERPNKIRRMDHVVGNVSIESPSTNFEYPRYQMSTSSTTPTTIEDHTQPSQPVTIPLPIVTSTQPSSSSLNQHVNSIETRELLNAEPMMDNVELVVEVRMDEFDREQVVDNGISTLNPVHIDQHDEEDEDDTIEQLEDLSADDERQVQVPGENFVKRIETDERGYRFECYYRGCGKRTKRKWDLVVHIRTHTGEMRFKCSVAGCHRAFVKKSHLDEHIRIHTGERPFECDQCDATFTQHNNLVTHLRIHTGERPFICTWPECGQAFTRSSYLKTHFLVHSNDCSFVCDVTGCNKVYKSKDALRKHKKAKHN